MNLRLDPLTDAEIDAREREVQDRADEIWADKEILSEILANDCLDYAEPQEEVKYSRELGIHKTGVIRPGRDTGEAALEALQEAKRWEGRDTDKFNGALHEFASRVWLTLVDGIEARAEQ